MNNIAQQRKAIGLTQAEFASALGWKPSRISNYELSIRKPGLEDCRLIIDGFIKLGADCSLDDIFPRLTSNAS
ncbi:helix-turn-helix transcriptional regulator [Enterobacter ludwigii]|uniref:helix-turn-helix transcriptional regulator n=1 Tax=Enterobacter ludwigii TaxID=299767 RepID=UPI003F6F4286